MLSTLINFIIIASFIFLSIALVYEASQFVPDAPTPHVTQMLSPTPEMPLELPIVFAPDTQDAEPLEIRPTPVPTSSESVPNRPEIEAMEDSAEDAPDTIALPDFHGMSVRQLREFCKTNEIAGYSKYAKCGKQVLADWLEVRALGEVGRVDTQNLRDGFDEGSETWHALNAIAQTL